MNIAKTKWFQRNALLQLLQMLQCRALLQPQHAASPNEVDAECLRLLFVHSSSLQLLLLLLLPLHCRLRHHDLESSCSCSIYSYFCHSYILMLVYSFSPLLPSKGRPTTNILNAPLLMFCVSMRPILQQPVPGCNVPTDGELQMLHDFSHKPP